MPDAVVVRMGSRTLEGWESIEVEHSLGAACGRARISAIGGVAPLLRQDEVLEVQWYEEPIFRGFVDTVQAEWSGGQASVQAGARSLTADLVDSSLDPQSSPLELREQTIEGIALGFSSGILRAGLTRELGEDLEPLPVFTAQSGDTHWEAIERACRQVGVLATAGRRGELRLIDPARFRRVAAGVQEGENVLNARLTADWRERFWSYLAEGETDPEGTTGVTGSGSPVRPSMSRFVPRGSTCSLLKAWRMSPRAVAARNGRRVSELPDLLGLSLSSRLGVRGLTGNLGRRGGVGVSLPSLRVNGELLIDSVRQTLDGDGMRTVLGMVRRDAYQSAPVIPAAAEVAGGVERMIGLAELRKALRPFSRRINGLVDRTKVVSVDESGEHQELQVDTGRGESHDRVKRIQEYGFASWPPEGAEAVVAFPGGYRSGGLALVVGDRSTRHHVNAPGETAIGNPLTGAVMVFSADGIVRANASLHVEGQLSDFRSSLEEMRTIFDAHVHPAPGSPTSTPMIPGDLVLGEPESSFLEGADGPPAQGLERLPGSRWVDLATGDVYQWKPEGWELEGLSLRGQTGDPGSIWFGGSGAPDPALGRPTDWHLDYANGDVRTKSTAGWVLLGNLMGPQGAQGETGPPGTTDHGAQTGLLDDDHPQYLLADGARTAQTLTVTGDVVVGGLVDGRDVDIDGAKLDRFAVGTTARQRMVWNANESRWDAELDRVKVQKVVANFVGPSGGVWTVQVLASEHGLGSDVEVKAWDTSTISGGRLAFGAEELSINAAGDVTLKVSVSPDGRRDVLFVVTRTL